MTATAVGGPLSVVELAEKHRGVGVIGESSAPRISALYLDPWIEDAAQYKVVVAPQRLSAIIERSDEGFIAESPELGSIGHGESPVAAFKELRDAVRDYLEVIKGRELAPAVADHANYVSLLEIPEEFWFAAVNPR